MLRRDRESIAAARDGRPDPNITKGEAIDGLASIISNFFAKFNPFKKQ